MGGDSEYEPKDSRNVTGEARTPDGRWSGDRQPAGHGGQYEPRDSRNVTGTASTEDGRWTNRDGKPPLAAGRAAAPRPLDEEGEEDDEDEDDYEDEDEDDEEDEDEDDEPVDFVPDPELREMIRKGRAH